MTIANVTAATTITAAWGNSVADQINLNTPAITAAQSDATDALDRLDNGALAVGEIAAVEVTPGSFASSVQFRLSTTDTTLARPAWASGRGFIDVTTKIRYTADANTANLLGGIAYRVNATGTWLYLSDNIAGAVYLPASTLGECHTRYVFTADAPSDYIEVAVAGRQTAGAGSVTINAAVMIVQSLWEV